MTNDSTIEYKQEWTPCFFTSSWIIKVFVNGKLFIESVGKDNEWTIDEKDSWIRAMLGDNVQKLADLGSDTTKEYSRFSKW